MRSGIDDYGQECYDELEYQMQEGTDIESMKKLTEQYRILDFGEFGDERGNLVVAEGSGRDIPFDIKRVFYMYGSDPDVVRGQHANRCSEFVLINVSGISKVRMDNGYETQIVELNKPRMGLYIEKMVWKDMYDFSEDSVLLVLANTHYDGSEYIRDYEAFLKEVKGEQE